MVEEGTRQTPNIDVYQDTARFVGVKTLEVAGEQLQAETIVIAAGTRPWAPEVPGLRDVPYITSDEALRLPEQPRRLTIVGGGFVGAEMAHFYGSLGTEVTIVQRGPTLLSGEDEDVARRFTEIYQRRFNLLLNAQVERSSVQNGETVLEVSADGRTQQVRGDALLVATGRVPNTDLLEVASTGVEVDDRGFVKADEYLETNAPGIWTLGDILGRYLLKHSANLEAAYVANNIFHPDAKVAADYTAMPHAVFASPQVASVGLTERAAKESDLPYVAATYHYSDTAYGASIEDHDGLRQGAGTPRDRRDSGLPHHRHRRLHAHPGGRQRHAYAAHYRRHHPGHLRAPGAAGGGPAGLWRPTRVTLQGSLSPRNIYPATASLKDWPAICRHVTDASHCICSLPSNVNIYG